MPSILRTGLVASLVTLLATSTHAQSPAAASATVALKPITTLGCYASIAPLVEQGSYSFQTSGYCQIQCGNMNKAVMAITAGSTCYCGDDIPAQSNIASSNSSCNTPCDGYGTDICGGSGYWTVYLTGLTSDVPTDESSSSSSSSSAPISSTTTSTSASTSTTQSPSVITKAGQTIVVTASSTATSSSSSSGSSSSSEKGGGTNKVGIAVGVVVGLLAVAGIVGGVIIFLKQRRRKAVEDDYRRNAAVSNFASSAKSETRSTNDERLDPSVFTHRRQSIGSIADERDFSRRILQVRNPDGV